MNDPLPHDAGAPVATPYAAGAVLPPGQRARAALPRFGLLPFARRFPRQPHEIALAIGGDVAVPLMLDGSLGALPRVEQTSDFHCVTTWSVRALRWGGVRFADVYEHLIGPQARPHPQVRFVVLRSQDGYSVSLPLQDLLAPDVLLADRLGGRPLPLAHGAPLRLVAPAHYGYKNAKHLRAIELRRDLTGHRFPGWRLMDHPRARVAFEERGRVAPGWLLRLLYRPLIGLTARRFDRALAQHGSGDVSDGR